jgi:Lon protease-like protein
MIDEPVGLFPLPNVVLLPGADLPLHIFEPRYRALTADALAGSGRVSIALLRPGYEPDYLGKPAIEPTVCVGRIVAHQKMQDGRYHLLLRGTTRARVVREVTEMPYRSAVLEMMPEASGDSGVSNLERNTLAAVISAGAIARTELGLRLAGMLSSGAPVGAVIDLLAFHTLANPAAKQAVLNETDPAARYALLTPVLLAISRAPADPDRADPNLN